MTSKASSLQKALSNNAQTDTSLCYTLSPISKSDGGNPLGQNRLCQPSPWAEDDNFSAVVSNNSTTVSSQKSKRNAQCNYFAKGYCKNGDACKFAVSTNIRTIATELRAAACKITHTTTSCMLTLFLSHVAHIVSNFRFAMFNSQLLQPLSAHVRSKCH